MSAPPPMPPSLPSFPPSTAAFSALPSFPATDFLAHFSTPSSASAGPALASYPYLAAPQDSPGMAGLPTWPFFAPSAPTAAFSAPGNQQLPLPDDILAGLLSTEGRAASEAAVNLGTFPSPAAAASSAGLNLFDGGAVGGGGAAQPGWYGFGGGGV
ncbi:hypothetical protein JCM10449v2_007072 [Rhodotorula kratochvilovae]